MKFSIILGTRPEIIKLSPIIRHCEKNNLNYFILHTNQHYSEDMDAVFFQELELPEPKYNLDVGSASHGKQTGSMLEKIEEVLVEENPTHVFVQGDTNTVLAGALAASKSHIKVVHVEAGLRSYDRDMPEEINRIVADAVSDILLCPTKKAGKILLKEGVPKEKIFVTGNTVVDAVSENFELALKKSKILEELSLKEKGYSLLTMHRPSNVDKKENLEEIFEGLKEVYDISKKTIIFPIHPRTKNNIEKIKIKIPEVINTISPVGYLDMLNLMKNADLIFTDSGGIQEEACILKVPTLTLRENTERSETLEAGANILVGCDKKRILEGFLKMRDVDRGWENPFGKDVVFKVFKIFD